MKQISLKSWIYFGVVFICLSLVVFHDYFSLDEPNVLWALRKGDGMQWYKQFGVGEGRPLYGFFQIATIAVGGTLANLKYARLVSIIVAFLVCRVIFLYMQRKNVPNNIAFLISVIAFSLPGFAVFISWAECTMLMPSIALSFYAGMLATKVFASHLGEEEQGKSKENLLIFLAIVLQIVSLFNYQSQALAFVIPAFFLLILNPEASTRKRFVFFISLTIVFIVSLGIYYELFKSSLQSSNIQMISRGKVDLSRSSGKLRWFINVLHEASKLHLVLFKNRVIQNLFTFLLISILIRDIIKKRFLDIFFLLAFSTLLFLPHFFIVDSWGASRNFLLISIIMVFYICIRIFEILPAPSVNVSAVIGLVFIALMAVSMWEGWVKPMGKDYKVIDAFVKKIPVVSTDTLIIIATPPLATMHEDQSFLKMYYDEFNAPVFFRFWPIEPSIKCIYQDMHPDIPIGQINKLIKVVGDTAKLPAYEANLTKIPLNLKYQ
jgi:hypothetical protein